MKFLTVLSVFTAATAAYSHQHAHPRVNFRNFRRANGTVSSSSSASIEQAVSTSSKASTKAAKISKAASSSAPVAVGTGGLTEKSKPVAVGTGGLVEKNRPAVGTGSGAAVPSATTAAASSGAQITTVVIKTTSVKTIISCAPEVTNCPGRNGAIATGRFNNSTSMPGVSQVVVTETAVLTSVVCPVSDVPKVESSLSKALQSSTSAAVGNTKAVVTPTPTRAATTSASTNGAATTTLVVKTTSVKTIISCAPEVTNCPGRNGTPATMTAPISGVSQVIITETAVLTSVVCPVSDVPKVQSSVSKALGITSSSQPIREAQTTTATEIKETVITMTTERVITVTLGPGGPGSSPNVITTTVANTIQSTSTATITSIHTVPCNGACGKDKGGKGKGKNQGGSGGGANAGTTTQVATMTGTKTMTVKKPGQTEVSPAPGSGNQGGNGGSRGGNQGGNGGNQGGNQGGNGGNQGGNGGSQGGNGGAVCQPVIVTKAAECPPPVTVTVTVTAPAAAATGPARGNEGTKQNGGKKEAGKKNEGKMSNPPAVTSSAPAAQASGDEASCEADEEEFDETTSAAVKASSTVPSMPLNTAASTKPAVGGKNGTAKANKQMKKTHPGSVRRTANLF